MNDHEEFKNLVWSNIAKIGVQTGNPSGRYLALQRDLAQQTLAAEIAFYRPKLVVFVSSDYAESIVRDLFASIGASQDDGSWQKVDDHLWWRSASGKLPAFMCVSHPQGKTRNRIAQWSECARARLLEA